MPAWLAFALGAVVLGTIFELVVGARRSSSNPPKWTWVATHPLAGGALCGSIVTAVGCALLLVFSALNPTFSPATGFVWMLGLGVGMFLLVSIANTLRIRKDT